MATVLGCASQQISSLYSESPQYGDNKFENSAPTQPSGLRKTAKIIWRYITEERSNTEPAEAIPMESIQLSGSATQSDDTVSLYRLGHSSLLLSLNSEFWLIDPVFGERASPFSWMGPKRFHQTPIALDQLPNIRGVIISHDHYDHLDQSTIEQLRDKVDTFITPLGVGQHLQKWGVDKSRIQELDWWQSTTVDNVKLVATPAQHFSGRGLTDGNQTLWASWVIQVGEQKLFYSGDTGYFEGFKEIGNRFGPFDLTIMENGAYDKDWADIHMRPEETLQAHLDLGGKAMLPVHNSTFDLAFHSWQEPLNRLTALAEENGVTLITPTIGSRVALKELNNHQARWWQEMEETEQSLVLQTR